MRFPSLNETVTLHFTYKGNLSELSETKRIVFSYGTAEGNIAETIRYDTIDKAFLLLSLMKI